MMNALYKPNASDLIQLQGLTKHPGFDTLKKLMESEVDRFQIDLMKTDPTENNYHEKLEAAHALAKASAMFYQRLMNRIHNENQEFVARQASADVLPDATEALFQ